MSNEIEREIERRGITRLCHFTPSRNLIHMADNQTGILSTKRLREDEQRVFTPTDLQRLDQHPNHVCCSIEYPNAWYLDVARQSQIVFRDWVIILIAPRHLWAPGTVFSSRNASAERGRGLRQGEEAFLAMYAEAVDGAGGQRFRRIATYLACCPTDQQAEVLIPDGVPFADILGVVVRDETQAKTEVARLRQLGHPDDLFKVVIAPSLFDKHALNRSIRDGTRPEEQGWMPGASHGSN